MLVAWAGSFSACNDTPSATPSGGSLSGRSAMGPDGENRPPTIRSVEFKPPHVLPGRAVRAHVEAIDPDGDPIRLRYRWSLRGQSTETAGGSFDVPASARRGDRVAVEVIASDGRADSEAFDLATRVANRRPTMREVRIQTEDAEDDPLGRWVARPLAEDPDGDILSFRYAWIVNGQASDNRGAWFGRSRSKRGDQIRLEAWASDGASESAPLTSAPFTVGNSPPEIVSRPPPMDDSGLFLYVVLATDRDGDTDLRYVLEEGPKGMTLDSASGELRWQATLENSGEHEVRIVVDDRNGGTSRQGFYVQVEMILPPPRFGGGAR
jgi:hypothetical protein